MNRLGYDQPIVSVPSELKTLSFWVNHLIFLNSIPLTIPQVKGSGSYIVSAQLPLSPRLTIGGWDHSLRHYRKPTRPRTQNKRIDRSYSSHMGLQPHQAQRDELPLVYSELLSFDSVRPFLGRMNLPIERR